MTDPVQITVDDDPFFIQQELVASQLQKVRDALNIPSLTKICLECGEPIGEGRLKAVPSATQCIDCASLH
jgi:RNA polymerase-binding transcription factor DksA